MPGAFSTSGGDREVHDQLTVAGQVLRWARSRCRSSQAHGRVASVAELGALVMVVGGFALLLGAFALFARRMRKRGLGGAIMGPIDEAWHPSGIRSRLDVETREERGVSTPSGEGADTEFTSGRGGAYQGADLP